MTPMTALQRPISRRAAIRGLAATAGIGLIEGPAAFAQGRELLFMEPFDLAFEYMHEMNGVVGGHFGKEGLDVRIDNARGTSVALQQVIAGQAFVTRVGALDLIKASAAQDVKLISIATSLQEAIFSLVSLKSAPLMSPQDLRGKTIGVASMGGGQENTLNLILASAGIPPSEVPRQAIGSNAGNVEVLKQGRVNGFFATVETSILLRSEPVEIWSASKYAPMPGGVIVTTRDFVDKNPDIAVKFVRAMRNSAKEILATDPNVIVERIEKKYDIAASKDRSFRVEAIKAYNAMTTAQGEQNIMRNVPEVWQKAAELVTKAGIAKVADVTTLYDNKYLDEAGK
jgi:ABC-type nitrate/sulfonate/bicarbonate transport system substrate-binding protein